jgi:hypothetical protein
MDYWLSLNEMDMAEPSSCLSIGLLYDLQPTSYMDLHNYTKSLAGQGGLHANYLTAFQLFRKSLFYGAGNASCSNTEPFN